jgi:sRNA-binding carbon storage regulator CsrA
LEKKLDFFKNFFWDCKKIANFGKVHFSEVCRRRTMLVTTLKEGDYLMVGDHIRVHFDHKVSSSILAIAVEAPKNMTILRKKLYEQPNRPLSNMSNNSGEISRLLVTLSKNDYIMIDDKIKVQDKKNNGRGFSIGVAAPREMAITHKKTFEADVAAAAAKGDQKARILADILEDEHTKRRQISAQRQQKQRTYLA